MHCLNFSVRHLDKPLHFCYVSKVEAGEALNDFAKMIASALDDELLVLQGEAGFLKRAFVAVELSHYADDEDDDGGSDGPLDLEPVSPGLQKKKRRRASKKGARRALEASLDSIVNSVRN
jgi:hypothetical protein